MSHLTADPIADGIASYARRLRAGQTTVEQTVADYISRAKALDGRLQAFQCTDFERAQVAARALDQLLASGTDLGPLMGVPFAVKDIMAVDGLPTTNGSKHPSEDITGPQGGVVTRLKRAGCVVLGKTRTVEFALGATGVNEARGTPWNPWDDQLQRIPGGSSSGSGVATAAGMCAFALGTDTGGSVRIPACYNGIYGHKSSVGRWPTDGVFPLSPSLDSIGSLCRTAADAALVHQLICDEPTPVDAVTSLAGLHFGLPGGLFLEQLDEDVKQAFEAAVGVLVEQGVRVTEIDIPQARERETLFPPIVGSEIIAAMTPVRFEQACSQMDTVTATRARIGLNTNVVDYVAAQKRRIELQMYAVERMAGFDGWLAPTCPMLPCTVTAIENDPAMAERALLSSRNTQPANIFGLCAASLPIPTTNPLPVGIQLMLPHGQDARLLSLSVGLQQVLGCGGAPDLAGFLS